MSQLNLIQTTAPSTPTSGKKSLYNDDSGNLRTVDSAGVNQPVSIQTNYSTSQQTLTATTLTYIVGTKLAIPTTKLQVGSRFRWKFNIHKSGAGTATSTFDIVVGTAGTTADTPQITFTKPAGTAVEDEGWITIEAIVRSIGATGVMAAEFTMIHNLAATGHATVPCVVLSGISAGFDMTVDDLFIGITATTGASDSITIEMAYAEAIGL